MQTIMVDGAQIGVHHNGVFHEFVPWNGVVNWEISPWGYWYLTAENETHLVMNFFLLLDPMVIDLNIIRYSTSRVWSCS